MKARIFAAVVVFGLLAGTSAFAQEQKKEMTKERPTAEQIAQKRTDRMTERFKLDEKQSKALYDYNLQTAQAQQTKWADMQKQMQAGREQMKADRAAREAKMKEILTPEQFTQWQAAQQHAHDKMMQHKGHHNGMHNGMHKGMQGCACCKCGSEQMKDKACGKCDAKADAKCAEAPAGEKAVQPAA